MLYSETQPALLTLTGHHKRGQYMRHSALCNPLASNSLSIILDKQDLIPAHHHPYPERNQTNENDCKFGAVGLYWREKYLVKAPMFIVTVTIRCMAVWDLFKFRDSDK